MGFPILRTLAASAALGTVLAGRATAQSTATNTPLDQIRVRLRALVVAEENYYSDHGSYTTDLAGLGMLPSRSDSVWIRVVHAGGRSWIADAHHRGLPGKSCVIHVGELADFPSLPLTEDAALPPAQEGAPTCDKP